MLLAATLLLQPDLEALAAAGKANLARFERGDAGWTAAVTLENGATIEVRCLKQGEARSFQLGVGAQDFGTLLIRDGLWHVSDPAGHRKHRPYEAAFYLPTFYLFLRRAEPTFVVDAKGFDGFRFEGSAGDVGTWRQPLPDVHRRTFESQLKQLDGLDSPKLAKTRAALVEMLEKGFVFRVHLHTGCVVETRNPKMGTRIQDFHLGRTVVPDVPPRAWVDYTDDPTKGKVGDLVLLAHTAVWEKGRKAGDMTLGLMDVGTGRFRRVPFDGIGSLPGSFSLDRRKVYLTGIADEGIFALYEVDLSTGANRRLAENLEPSGQLLFATLSPDGRRLAALHGGGERKVLESDLALVDVETGDARYVGKPADRAFLSWLPDGRSLLLLERVRQDLKDEGEHWICRMDLEGRTSRIRLGEQPTLLRDGKTILYQDREAGTWWTCDLEGENEKLFGDGRKACGMPSPAPDGRRLLMMRYSADGPPEPLVIDLVSGEERVLPRADGLWGMPAWR